VTRLTSPRWRAVRNGLIGLFGIALLSTMASPASNAAAPPVPGSAGVDTSLPDTDSAVTVRGRGAFSDLEIRVNQTRDLVNQAVSLTWTGATPTISTNVRFSQHYLQIFQCWGEADGSVPGNPGPPPEQCVQGAADGVPDSVNTGLFPAGGQTLTRIISRVGWANYDQAIAAGGVLDPTTGLVWRPFRSVDGQVITNHVNPAYDPFVQGSNYWVNPYFNIVTTNEVTGSRTPASGEGGALFRVDTGVESSGLGCGQRLLPAGGGSPFTPKCWLVIVPRGSAVEENAGTPFVDTASTTGVFNSPLSPVSWANRIAVPLEFNPVDSQCSINDEDRRIVGTELLVPAVSSWQLALCATEGLPPFTYGTVTDSAARQQISQPAAGAAGMAVTQRPLDPQLEDPRSPTVYAPLTVSGAVIGFTVERSPLPSAPAEAQELSGIRVAELNLTPRLVAKLLTQSYRSQVDIRGEAAPYEWRVTNADDLGTDPDFLQFNPEFQQLQSTGGRNFGGLALPVRNSDLAREVWQWVLADPEAKAWLDGRADPWGMVVNPVYATTATANVNGFPFADPVPDSFPKADPFCFESPPRGEIQPTPLCGTDWMPYLQGLREGAGATRTTTDGARVVENPFAQSADQVWRRAAPQPLGRRQFLSLTDSASAAQFGIQVARLSRAGDNRPDRRFIAPDNGGLTAGIAGFVATTEPAVLEPDPTGDAPAGYPLTALTYAAVRPLALDAPARAEYAAFIEYAAGSGQVQGTKGGELPPGYAAMPIELREQARAAAATIRDLQPAAPPSEEAVPPPASATPSAFPIAPASPARSGASTSPSTAPPVPAAPAAAVEAVLDEPASSGLLTPILALARNRFVLPVMAATALVAALGALEVAKRPRRAGRSAGGA
jgi:hypothetical protein